MVMMLVMLTAMSTMAVDGDGTGVDDGHIVIAMEKRHEPSDFNITFVYVQDVATYGIIPWW